MRRYLFGEKLTEPLPAENQIREAQRAVELGEVDSEPIDNSEQTVVKRDAEESLIAWT